MNDLDELYHIGWDDYLLRDGIVVVEWGEKADGLLPDNVIEIGIAIVSDDERKIEIGFKP
jgi:tRNA threonylcarbamoyladenosine biosynthesis protein TsaE